MSQTKLLPCPFCGEPAEMDTYQNYRNISTGNMETGVAIYCVGCGVQAMLCRGDIPDLEPEMVVEIWNRRALSAPSPVEGGGELEYAQRLATVAASKFGPPPGWKPLGDMFGVLSQIDNCLTGLEAPTSPPQATNSVTNQCDLGDLCICISAHAQCSHWKTSVYAELAEAASRVINDAARERDGQSLVDDRALEALAQALKGILS